MFLFDEGPTLETLDFTINIGSTPTYLYFDLYLNTAYAAHYVYFFTDVILTIFLKCLWNEFFPLQFVHDWKYENLRICIKILFK